MLTSSCYTIAPDRHRRPQQHHRVSLPFVNPFIHPSRALFHRTPFLPMSNPIQTANHERPSPPSPSHPLILSNICAHCSPLAGVIPVPPPIPTSPSHISYPNGVSTFPSFEPPPNTALLNPPKSPVNVFVVPAPCSGISIVAGVNSSGSCPGVGAVEEFACGVLKEAREESRVEGSGLSFAQPGESSVTTPVWRGPWCG